MLKGLETCRRILNKNGLRGDIVDDIYSYCSDGMEKIFIVRETLNVIRDTSVSADKLDERTIVAYCMMIYRYLRSCGIKYEKLRSIKNLASKSSVELYKIDASLGNRYATKGEVENGVRGLIPYKIYPAGEDACIYLNLLAWSMTGNIKYIKDIKEVGIPDTFNVDKSISWTFGFMQKYPDKIISMIVWMENASNYVVAQGKINAYKKNPFRYAEFAQDEVKENISVKQIIYGIRKECIGTNVIGDNTDDSELTPYQISSLRKLYHSICSGNDREGLIKKCEYLTESAKKGYIDEKEFVFRIIETLSKNKYSRCSEKQMGIIDDAVRSVNNFIEKAFCRNVDNDSKFSCVEKENEYDEMHQMSLSNLYKNLI